MRVDQFRTESGDDLFDGWWRLPADDPADGLAAAIAEFRPTLVHSHNLPDSLTVLALVGTVLSFGTSLALNRFAPQRFNNAHPNRVLALLRL